MDRLFVLLVALIFGPQLIAVLAIWLMAREERLAANGQHHQPPHGDPVFQFDSHRQGGDEFPSVHGEKQNTHRGIQK